ncbi:hypothetical protein [Bathymodiolus thermophilus thioautotrophic gill symbiont]|nr:hypothetical protein [Bathymodiolus thermophilus thioautotrophic gill symbiont]
MQNYQNCSIEELIIIANKMFKELDDLFLKIDCDLLDIRENNKIAA